MALNNKLSERAQGMCELCTSETAVHEYTVSPKSDDNIEHQVALCDKCLQELEKQNGDGTYWRFLEGTIWNPEPPIQALSYRILHTYKDQDWAADIINSIEVDENIVQWALSAFEVEEVHRDSFGNKLENGDTVVLTQALDVKGTNFSAPKGTVVKRIRLVADNVEQIEGKINDLSIVILTKYVKKG